MTVDLVLKNAKVYVEGVIVDGGVAVEEGKIVSISKDPNLPKANKTIDCRGGIILPGLIDPHVHFRDPGYSAKEDFLTGSMAAAAGGFTLVMDMPNTYPPVITSSVFREKLRVVQSKSIIDFCLYAGCGTDSLDEIEGMVSEGAVAFKTWTHVSNRVRDSTFRGLYSMDENGLSQVMNRVAKTGLPIAVHAEDASIIDQMTLDLQQKGRQDPYAHPESQPRSSEEIAVSSSLRLAKYTKVRLYLLHITTKEAVDQIRTTKMKEQMVFAETCPQYLLLSKKIIEEKGPYAKMNPPLRDQTDQESLWNALAEGVIDCLSSDHAPHLKKEKEVGWTDIWAAPSGAPSIEVNLSLMLTKLDQGLLSIQKLIEIMSTNAAKLFGLYPKKGIIAEGSDADLTVIDQKATQKIRADRLYTKAWECVLYDGWEVKGKPILTVSHGQIVMDNGIPQGKPGEGRFERPCPTNTQRIE